MFSEQTHAGEVAFITGGGSGIGLGLARRYGQLGAKVFLASRNEAKLAEAADGLRAEGIEAAWAGMDVRDPAQIASAVDACEAALGPVDLLVNNAAGNFVCPAEDLSPNGWRAVVDIVLDGSFFASREVGRRMIARGAGGNIVSIVATYIWAGGPGVIHSACAKAGVATMTQTLAVEWASRGIRVNAVAPGPIITDGSAKALWDDPATKAAITAAVPLKRFGEVDEVANLVTFLTSPYAAYITGEVVVIDGGERLGKGLQGLTSVVLNRDQ